MIRIGVDLGGTNIKAGLVDENQRIISTDSVLTYKQRSADDIIRDMAELIKALLDKNHLKIEDLAGIGIGCPGTIDAQNGIVLYSNNIAWRQVALKREMQKYFSCLIEVSNDANVAALGEVKAGAGKKVRNAILLTLGTGVGGGIILDGKIYEGAHVGGAELGHTSLILGGKPCTCGRNGCVEAYVSASALIRDAKEAMKKQPDSLLFSLCDGLESHIDGKLVFDAAKLGDKAAKNVVDQYILYLGEAIVNFVNIFRPDMVLLSGGICNQGDYLTKPLQKIVEQKSFGGGMAYVPEIACASLGYEAGILGAANLIDIHL